MEGIKEEVVLSPGHALSFIAAGEGSYVENDSATILPILFSKLYVIYYQNLD